MVDVVPLLVPDLMALNELFSGSEPAHCLECGDKVKNTKFVFGDASGGGFGSLWEVKDNGKSDNEVEYGYGT